MIKRVCMALVLVLVGAGVELGFAQQGGYIEPTSDNYGRLWTENRSISTRSKTARGWW